MIFYTSLCKSYSEDLNSSFLDKLNSYILYTTIFPNFNNNWVIRRTINRIPRNIYFVRSFRESIISTLIIRGLNKRLKYFHSNQYNRLGSHAFRPPFRKYSDNGIELLGSSWVPCSYDANLKIIDTVFLGKVMGGFDGRYALFDFREHRFEI